MDGGGGGVSETGTVGAERGPARGRGATVRARRGAGGPGGDEPLARRARMGQVLALVGAGEEETARHAADALRSELRTNADPAERLGFLSRYATEVLLAQSDLELARDALEEAEPLMENAAPAALADALATRAWIALRFGEASRALADAEAAAELLTADGDSALEARVLNTLGLAVGIVRSPPEGKDILERAVQRSIEGDQPAEAARAYVNLSFMDEMSGDTEAVRTRFTLALSIDGAPAAITAMLQSNLASVEANLGNLDAGLAHGLAALRIAARGGSWTRIWAASALAYVHLWRGELAAMRRILEGYELESGAVIETRAAELWGLLLEEEGALAESLAHYQRGAALEDPMPRMNCEAGVARTAVAIGELNTARAALARMDEFVSRAPGGEWMREEARGWVAAGEHRTEDAIEHLRAAAGASNQAYDAARLRLEAARLASDQDQLRPRSKSSSG